MSGEQDEQDVDRFTVFAFRAGLAAVVLGLLLLLVAFAAVLLAIWLSSGQWEATAALCGVTGFLLVGAGFFSVANADGARS